MNVNKRIIDLNKYFSLTFHNINFQFHMKQSQNFCADPIDLTRGFANNWSVYFSEYNKDVIMK